MSHDVVLKARCNAYLLAMLGESNVEKWWQSPNKAFDLQKPIDVFEKNPESVFKYVQGCSDGYW